MDQGAEILLSGNGTYDEHHFTGRQIRCVPRYELDETDRSITIVDPVWGEHEIGDQPGDQVLVELYTHPVFQRLRGIEQLTLPEHYATMPGSVDLTRWEHAWGSVVLVRKVLEQAEADGRQFDPRQKLVWQLRTLVSDAGHTAFSHLGDWLKQGAGGNEDAHDQTLPTFLESTGINDILRRHGIEPEEVIFPAVDDWVEEPSPNLCVDRVDYGVREILRWVRPGHEYMWREAFALDEQNHLVMKDQQSARLFAAGYGLLVTEHWSHPVHRLQELLFTELIKGALTEDETTADLQGVHPLDALDSIDDAIITATRMHGELNSSLHAIMLDIARAQRRIFSWNREHDISSFMERVQSGSRQEQLAFPNPLDRSKWFAEYSGAQPQNIELTPVNSSLEAVTGEVTDFGQLPHSIDFYLGCLKQRIVDPLFLDGEGNTRRLSQVDSQAAALLEQCRAQQMQRYVARIYLAPWAAAELKQRLATVQQRWNERLQLPRGPQTSRAVQQRIAGAALHASISSPFRASRQRLSGQ